ncbi:flavoprotein [Streptomyces sp. NBC_00073]|uniref:flavoprotein n=1 Tax=Streptomyces sp. NBC_00073 TaxID=2975640 RepID=UPI002F918792
MHENPAAAPRFTARRLLYVGTGSLGVMFMPMWVHWLRSAYPELAVRTVITRSATKFVTPTALSVFAGHTPQLDSWGEEPETSAAHVEMAEWADTVIVHPATFHFTSRLALGVADTPVLLALQCTRAPIVLAPALPPGALASAAWESHMAALERRPNVHVVPPHPGVSITTGKPDAATAAPLPEVLLAAERLRAVAAGGASDGANASDGTDGTDATDVTERSKRTESTP